MIDESYIRTSDIAIQDVSYNTLYNMSFLLRDKVGRIPTKDAKLIQSSLKVSAVGEVQGMGADITLPNDVLLGKEEFNPSLSHRALSIYSTLGDYSSPYITTDIPVWSEEVNPLFTYLEGAGNEATHYMCYIYLELYSLMTSIVDYTPGGVLGVTLDEIDVFLSNTRYISAVLGGMGNQEDVYGLLNVLKHVQMSILFAKKGITTILR